MDQVSALTVIGITCLAIISYAYQNGADSLTIAGVLTIAIGAGLVAVGMYVKRHNRP